MAAPITHTILTDRLFDDYFAGRDRRAFYVGTNFPDIRYLAGIDRTITHPADASMDAIANEQNDVRAGVLWHVVVDDTRRQFMMNQNLFDAVGATEVRIRAVKLLEDEILYNRREDWDVVANYFERRFPEETAYEGIDDDVVRQWHTMLQEYVTAPPSQETRTTLLQGPVFTPERIAVLEETIAELRGDATLEKLVMQFYETFPDALQQ